MVARFLPGLRAPTYFTVGHSRLPYWEFLFFDGVAALVSAPLWVCLGFWFGDDIQEAAKVAARFSNYVLLALAAMADGAPRIRGEGSANSLLSPAPAGERLGEGAEVIVSRGQLVEIGGGFRIPDVLRRSGAMLVEVGTTNRTYLRDYEEALGPRSRVLLAVHRSNFRLDGFVTEPTLEELVALGRRRDLWVVDDLGSGALLPTGPLGLAPEPTVAERVRTGADLVCFSGDKLLGGPQAGLVVENSKGEWGPGQEEINVRYADARRTFSLRFATDSTPSSSSARAKGSATGPGSIAPGRGLTPAKSSPSPSPSPTHPPTYPNI